MLRIWQISRTVPLLLLAVVLALGTTVAPAAANDKYAAFVIDAKTGKTLFARNADARRYPASLTKMMTLYVLFEDLKAGRFSLDSRLEVSAWASGRPPSKLGLRPGSTIRVEDAIQALTTKSANDVAAVVAENVAGSESAFAKRMTRTARAIGMKTTVFQNPHGLPNNDQYTTAREMATLGRALHDRFPEYYKYFSVRSFKYGKATYRNHNHLLGSVKGVDGIKTGYINASGFNLVTNVERDGRHIVAVVMGGRTGASRDAHMRELIATYLPKASKGPRTAPLLVAANGYAPEPPAPAPLPRARPLVAQPAIAYAAPQQAPTGAVAAVSAAAASALPARAVDPIAERIAVANNVAEFAYVPENGSNDDPIARLTELAHSRAEAIPGARPATLVEEEDIEGWHVQIAAVPTEEDAQAVLEKAKAAMGADLAAADPVTQVVEKNGVTLYRARFAGFADKDAAWAACSKLKSRSFDCLALAN